MWNQIDRSLGANRIKQMRWHPQCLVILMACSQAFAQPTIDPCLKAADYKGCRDYHDERSPGQVVVDKPNDHEYRPESIQQQKVRGHTVDI